jgi:hypothetical protein
LQGNTWTNNIVIMNQSGTDGGYYNDASQQINPTIAK